MKSLPEPRKRPGQARSQHTVDVIVEATARVLAERGYAGTNTNLVAARAGVSVGSIYQYFPNKDALVIALHERHAAQMCAIINGVLDSEHPRGLNGHIEAVVHALVAAHRLEPALHKVLEKEFPFFDAPKDQSPADNVIFDRIRALLEAHRARIRQQRPRVSHVDRAADHGSPGSCGGDRPSRPVRDRRYRAIHRGCHHRLSAGAVTRPASKRRMTPRPRDAGRPWSRPIDHPAPRANPTATGVASPSV